MHTTTMEQLIDGIRHNQIVPYLGFEALTGVTALDNGETIPADSDSLILAMNSGKPMAPS